MHGRTQTKDPISVLDAVAPRSPAERLADRYGQPPAAPPVDWNHTLDVILSHRSVRHFQPKPLGAGALETLTAAAQSAPTSSNLQVWSVVAVEDAHRKARLAALAGNQDFIRAAPLFLVWLIDHNKLRSAAQAQEREARALDYVESFLLGAVDTALAAQNATVALESLGLGATYVGAVRNKPQEIAKELALPAHVFPLFGMAVGWPDTTVPAAVKPRHPQEAVLFREHYAWGDAQVAALDRYNPQIRRFQRRQGMAEQDWTVQAVNRTTGPQSMAGRHVLREVLQRLGFDLR